MNQEMIKVLQATGLTEGDSKVYLALFESGETTVGEIEKKTQLQRTSIYFSLNKLIEQGLASFNLKNNIKYFQASDPKRISELLEQKKNDFDKILPNIEILKNKEQEAEVGIFQGYNALRNLINSRLEILHKGDTICIINPSQVQAIEKYQNLYHQHDIRRVQKGIKLKIITHKKYKEIVKKEYGKYKLREDKFTDIESPTSITIYSNYVQIALYKGSNADPINIRIHDKELAKFYKQYFEVLWKQSKT